MDKRKQSRCRCPQTSSLRYRRREEKPAARQPSRVVKRPFPAAVSPSKPLRRFSCGACARVGRSGVASRPASFMRNVAQQSYSARAFCSRGVARFGSNGTLEKRSRERPSRTPIELGRSRQRPARYPPIRPHGRPPPRGGPCRRCGLLSPVHMIKLTKRARLCIRMRNGRAAKETCATRANRPRGASGISVGTAGTARQAAVPNFGASYTSSLDRFARSSASRNSRSA
jgi:hypothetical protein